MSTTVGTKGSDVYTSEGVGDPRVALSVLLVRGQTKQVIETGLKKILNENFVEDAFVLSFMTRNIRGGTGERDVSRIMFKILHQEKPNIMMELFDLIPHYGCWNDIFTIWDESGNIDIQNKLSEIILKQLKQDEDNIKEEKPISLLAKWIPRENRQGHIAQHLARLLFPEESFNDMEVAYLDNKYYLPEYIRPRIKNKLPTDVSFQESIANELVTKILFKGGNNEMYKEHTIKLLQKRAEHVQRIQLKLYRKKISKLNKQLNTVEIKQCDNHWADIKPETVPGRALARYKTAFLNMKKHNNEIRYPDNQDRIECAEHFKNHTKKVLLGVDNSKVNAVNTVLPSDIYKNIISNINDISITDDVKNINRAQWKMIRDDLKSSGIFKKMLAMCDFSGSMSGDPVFASGSLGILLSEICEGQGKNKIMTFDSTPKWIEFPENADIYEKVEIIRNSRLGQGLSTDFQKAMDLYLTNLKKNRTPIEDQDDTLVVFTDMCWDAACGSSEESYYTGNTYRNHVKTDSWQTHIEMIRESFKRAGEDMFGEGNGYTMPRIVIWNLRATAGEYHAQANTEGVLMYSGWSPSVFKQLVKEGFTVQNPVNGLLLQLDDPMYDIIRTRIRNIQK
jgi:hypothetical protein